MLVPQYLLGMALLVIGLQHDAALLRRLRVTVEKITENRFNIATRDERGEPEFMLVNDSHDGSCWLWDYTNGRRFLEASDPTGSHQTTEVAEEVLDAIAKSTGVPARLTVTGAASVSRAMLLPDPTEGGTFAEFLNNFERGNRDDQPRNGDGSIVQALALLNDSIVTDRIASTNAASLVARLIEQSNDPAAIAEQRQLATRAFRCPAEHLHQNVRDRRRAVAAITASRAHVRVPKRILERAHRGRSPAREQALAQRVTCAAHRAEALARARLPPRFV